MNNTYDAIDEVKGHEPEEAPQVVSVDELEIEAATDKPRTLSRKWLAGGVAAAVAAIGIIAVTTGGGDGFQSTFDAAAEADVTDDLGEYLEVADGGSTLILEGHGEDDGWEETLAALDVWEFVANDLDIPQSVQEQVGHTSSLDGRQEASWDGYTASWKYHPDNGLDMTITLS